MPRRCLGPAAGASQPHKHIQIVPLPLDDSERSSSSKAARPPIWPAVAAATSEVAPGCPVELRSLPFAGFAAALDVPQAGDAGAYLAGCYQELLSCCRTFVEGKTGRRVDVLDGSLSYNLSG